MKPALKSGGLLGFSLEDVIKVASSPGGSHMTKSSFVDQLGLTQTSKGVLSLLSSSLLLPQHMDALKVVEGGAEESEFEDVLTLVNLMIHISYMSLFIKSFTPLLSDKLKGAYESTYI